MYIWTDGACSHNPGPGGWAFIAETGDSDSGYEVETTNQRMEMIALYNALRYSEELPMEKITILTDSAYCCNCYKNKWYIKWEKNGWQNAKKEPVKNRDLWEKIVPYFKNDRYSVEKVKGHADDFMNNEVDRLAVAARIRGEKCL